MEFRYTINNFSRVTTITDDVGRRPLFSTYETLVPSYLTRRVACRAIHLPSDRTLRRNRLGTPNRFNSRHRLRVQQYLCLRLLH